MMLAESLRAAGRRLGRIRIGRAALPGLVAAVSALALGAWLLRAGVGAAPLVVLGGWLVVVASMLVAAGAAWRRSAGHRPAVLARELEDGGAWRAGSLSTLLDPVSPGTSASLHDMAVSDRAREVRENGAAALEPLVRREMLGLRRLALPAIAAGLLLLMARPHDGAARLMMRPATALGALIRPITLAADREQVSRGEAVTFTIAAPGHDRAVLRLRRPGESWTDEVVELDQDGRGTFSTGALEADLVARADAGGRRSEEVRIGIILPAFVGAFGVTAHYPSYLELESEQLPVDGDTLVIPEGTRLAISGSATTDLASASLSGAGGEVRLDVAGHGFSGNVVPVDDREWVLAAATASGVALASPLPRFSVRVIADSAPSVSLLLPAGDTTALPAAEVPVVVAVRDDHRIRSVSLELRRGMDGRPVSMPLSTGSDPAGAEAMVSAVIPLATLSLSAGDTVFYRAVAMDDSPRRQQGRSAEYRIVIPTAAEQRTAGGEEAARSAASLDSLVDAARQAQRRAEDLSRQRLAGGEEAPNGSLTAEAAQRIEQTAQAQEAIEERLAGAMEQLEQLEQRLEQSGVIDSAMAGQLSEIRDLLERAIPPELRAAMNELREAVRQLDGDRATDALAEMARQQERMRQAMEQARELFERAALEMDLASLADEAGELSELQKQLAEAMRNDSSGTAAGRQEELAERAEALAEALKQAAERMPVTEGKEGMKNASSQAQEAGSEMRSAAASAAAGEEEMAVSRAESAGETMSEAEEQIRKERQEMQQGMRREVLEAMDRLLLETSRVAQQQQRLAETFRRGALSGELRSEQAVLEEGAARLLQQAIAVAGKNALVSPRIAAGITGARDAMRGAIEATSSAVPSPGMAADRAAQAVDALAIAAYELLRSRDNISGTQSGSGMAEAMQQMQQLAGQQGGMSQQGQSMMDEGGTPSMAEMMQLAMQQRAIARQLELLQAGGEMPGAGTMADEAAELARSLESGRLDRETVERQQRLFRRMLDAGRSLQGSEEDRQKDRQSETGSGDRRSTPPVLDPALLRNSGDLALPRWEELQRLSPDERRRVVEYFRRLAEGRAP